MFPVFFLLLTPAALMSCVLVTRAATRAHRENRPAPHLVLASLALGLLALALPTHAYGQMTMFHFNIDEQCPARGAGEFIDFQESFLPISGVLECTNQSIQLVPAWVNPTVTALLAAGTGATLAASIVWIRNRRTPAAG